MPHFYSWTDLPQTPMAPGIWRRLVSGEKVMIVQVTLDKGAVVDTHQHPHEQMTHPLSGVLELEINGQTRIMRPGDVAHIPANTPHRAVALEDVITLDIFSPPREDFLT
ncbi:MAG: cupin domain-containing protein [Anaerolineae bacterium]|nr:cupin domain-containing protein [Anaerolineae bacterium]